MRNGTIRYPGSDAAPGPDEMSAILRRCGIRLAPARVGQLWTYHQLLREFNPELNLTRIHNFTNMVLKLYVDSILPMNLVELPSPLMDLGSGPGMPGIPIKIAMPELEIVLAESRQKRAAFLRMAVERLKLEKVEVVGKSVGSSFEVPVKGVITRAVESVGATLERIAGCLDRDGLAIFMKGPQCDAEIGEALKRFRDEYRLWRDIHYTIPHTRNERRLVVFQRLGPPTRIRKETAMKRHGFRKIESESNDLYRDIRKLLTSRGIRKQQRALVSGSKQVHETLRDFPDDCLAWIAPGEEMPPPEGSPGHMSWYQMAPALFETLDVFGTRTPLLLIGVGEIETWDPAEGFPAGCSVLVPFQDPENVGAVIRSAAAFGAVQVILLRESAHPFHPKALRASGGAVLRIKLRNGPPLENLPENLPILPLSAEGRDITQLVFPAAFGLLPGLEGPGLPDNWRRKSFAIPICGDVESLNAATAAAIALYAWSRSGLQTKHSPAPA
ncbi:MAG TPA: 16S rRNA (guanine(527)-N(7))-methyltransferase RsmG [Syntrophobacter fumaroxidans]|nr:16S rRNA (guanine(527)-N(7))-methyltransferase RsmG [Syntrophobacter fumaroxidans]